MNTSFIPYAETGYFAKIVTDYIAQAPGLAPFYEHPPTLEGFEKAIQQKTKHAIDRKVLVDVLQEQYKGLSGKGLENIAALGNDRTFSVTTGHQLNLFTGPLYFIYKIITTIKLAEEIQQKYPAYKIVPIYWMATEDHDFAEINHIHLYGKKITWEQETAGATGKISTAAIGTILTELKTILGEGEQAQGLFQRIELAYTQHTNLAAATRALVHELFQDYGLVIIDADDARFKKAFANIMLTDITEQHSHRLISATNEQLKQAYEVQVNPREINFFYLDKGLRERIIQEGETYAVNNSSLKFTAKELADAIQTHPERFSPNVVTRPLYQESILPNIAYIGGGAEIAYWLELKATFQQYQIPYPTLLLRNSVLWIDEGSKKRLDKLGIQAVELFQPINELIKSFIHKNQHKELSLEAECAAIAQSFQNILQKGLQQDPTLKGLIEAEKTKTLNAIAHIEQRLVKAEKKKHETEINQLEKVQEKLFPNGGLQERHENVIAPLINNPDFIKILYSSLYPLNNKLTIFS